MKNVRRSTYRDVLALELDTGKFRIKFLPENGGRLISLIDERGREWMASESGDHYRELSLDSSYVDADVCGMDDMFPTIDPEIAPVEGGCRKGVLYNDHGEIARSCYDQWSIEDGMIRMGFTSTRLLYRYEKLVRALPDGAALISYKITNLSSDPFPFLWAGHCMLAAVPGGKVELPFQQEAEAEMCFDENLEYGPKGANVRVTDDMLISRSFSPDGNAYKFYYLDKTPAGVIRYTVGGHSFVMEYDETKLPYVGVWMNNGKFKGFPCVTPEPCTVAFDKVTEARRRGQQSVIRPGESFSFNIKISIQ